MKQLLDRVDIRHIENFFIVGLSLFYILDTDLNHISAISIARLLFILLGCTLIVIKTDMKERRNATVFFIIGFFAMQMISLFYRGTII